jgi:hypothetical protein
MNFKIFGDVFSLARCHCNVYHVLSKFVSLKRSKGVCVPPPVIPFPLFISDTWDDWGLVFFSIFASWHICGKSKHAIWKLGIPVPAEAARFIALQMFIL